MSIKRTIEINSVAHLSCHHQQLSIDIKNGAHQSVPIEDIGFLILDNIQLTHTQYLLSECAAHNVAVLVCDAKHLPTSMLMPLQGHTLQARIMQQQAGVTEDVKQEVWRQIISAKISAQQHTLKTCASTHPALDRLAKHVLPGDPKNCEAQAARIYFPTLFGEHFHRDQSGEGINALLNYGYTLLRAACARALMGAGLHPTLGVHHHNQYDSLCLADDIMEPLRPMMDEHIHAYISQSTLPELNKQTRTHLISWLGSACCIGRRSNVPLMVALEEYCSSVRSVLFQETKTIKAPVA